VYHDSDADVNGGAHANARADANGGAGAANMGGNN
jgi:hypothetical protein